MLLLKGLDQAPLLSELGARFALGAMMGLGNYLLNADNGYGLHRSDDVVHLVLLDPSPPRRLTPGKRVGRCLADISARDVLNRSGRKR